MNRASMRCSLWLLVASAVLLTAGSAQAAWSLVDNFNTETANITISGQVAPSGQTWGTYTIVPGNGKAQVISNPTGVGTAQVLSMTNSNYNSNMAAYLPLSIPVNTANATLFFQIYGVGASTTQGGACGMVPVTPGTPGAYSGYILQELASGIAGDPVLDCRNGGAYNIMLSGSTTPPVAANTWYDVWLVFHTGATTGSYDVYIGDVNGNIKASATNQGYRTQSGSMSYLCLDAFAEVNDGTLGTTYYANVYFDPTTDNHLTTPIAVPTYVALNLSGGFNQDAIIGPVVAMQSKLFAKGPMEWMGNEPQGLAQMGNTMRDGIRGDYEMDLICDSSSRDGIASPYYMYYAGYALGWQNIVCTGSQALPENGILTSTVDGRTYMIASVSGNTLLPGDWVDPPYNQSLSGTLVGSGANQVVYGTTTYTASNPKLNTMLVGQDNTYASGWSVTSQTATITPGYYSDINFAMKGSGYYSAWAGAAGAQIWVNYTTGSSQRLYSFVTGELSGGNPVNPANFNTLYLCGYSGEDLMRSGEFYTDVEPYKAVLYEFSSPKTLDSTRMVSSITLSYVLNSGAQAELAIFGATAKTATGTSNYTLALNVGPTGTAIVTPSQASYTFGQQVTVTMSTITAGNVLDHWVLSGAGTLSNSGAISTLLTITGNDTLTAVYTSGSYVNTLSPVASDSNPGSLQLPFKTILRAGNLATVGQTIVVQQGVYRENDSTLTINSGTAGSPITVRTNPGDRVVLSGAGLVPSVGGSWTQCTSTTASGNPNYAKIYYTDLPAWNANYYGLLNVAEDENYLAVSKWPAATWYACTGGTSMTLVDTVNLTQTDAHYFDGAIVCRYDNSAIRVVTEPIQSFDPVSHTLSLAVAWNLGENPTAGEGYFIMDQVRLMSGPGTWACQGISQTTSTLRVFVWPAAGDRPDGHMFEATQIWPYAPLSYGLLGTRYQWNIFPSYWVFDGLEVRDSGGPGIGLINCGGSITVQNCVVHHNGTHGVYTSGNGDVGGLWQHNLVVNNGTPIMANGAHEGIGLCGGIVAPDAVNLTIKENEVAFNEDDGIWMNSASMTSVGNFVHDHNNWGHGDSIQFAQNNQEPGCLVQSNIFTIANDGTQANNTYNTTWVNNIFMFLQSFPIQGGDDGTADVEHNTFLMGGWGGLNNYGLYGTTSTLVNNLVDEGYNTATYWPSGSAVITSSLYSDYNGFFLDPDYASSATIFFKWNNQYYSVSDYSAATGQEKHSAYGNPQFTAAPAYFVPAASPGGFGQESANRMYFSGNSDWLVGDFIEVGVDGIQRTITATTTAYIQFTPSDAKFLFMQSSPLENWKNVNGTSHTMDLTPNNAAFVNKGNDGKNLGSNIKIADYWAGKLNGNTSRVIPVWPPAASNLASTGWKYMNGGTANSLTEGNTYTNPNMTGFQLTLSAPLYAPSCTNSLAVTVVDNTGTTYPINAATLDSTGTVLTIVLTNGALPRTKTWIQVNVGPLLMGANGNIPTVAGNGGPVTGVRSMRFTIN